MKIYFKSQDDKLNQHLEFLKKQPVMPYDQAHLVAKTSLIELNTTKHLTDLNLSFLFNYNIFPKHILVGLTQWRVENRMMLAGDTIAQQVFVPPVKSFSQKIIFGVRISEIIDSEKIKGFSYETVHGHVERGVSTFIMEQQEESKLIFKIQTYSTPGNFLSRLLGPVFSIPYQTYCSKSALANVKTIVDSQSH